MSAPVVVSVNPTNLETDVVLGSQIVITFDQPIDPTTVTASTISVTGPGTTQVLTPEQMLVDNPTIINSRQFLTGKITFDTTNTVVTFNPDQPFDANLVYTVQLIGGDGVLTSDSIANPGAEKMPASYQWSFTTGDLNLTAPPVMSPTLDQTYHLNPTSDIQVRINNIPLKSNGNDLSFEIEILFPAAVDPGSFNLSDILLSIEPILGDLNTVIPPGLVPTVVVTGNKIVVTISGWPA